MGDTPGQSPKRFRKGSPLLFATPPHGGDVRLVDWTSPSQPPAQAQYEDVEESPQPAQGSPEPQAFNTDDFMNDAEFNAPPSSPESSDDESSPERTFDPLGSAVNWVLGSAGHEGHGGRNNVPRFDKILAGQADAAMIRTFIGRVVAQTGDPDQYTANATDATIAKFVSQRPATFEQVRDALVKSGAVVDNYSVDYSLLAGFADLAMARF